ncbi:MAG: hypothetical protein KBG15_17510 [Kofleriaceae bacterium]|nr:hypothetical protein [Kofleriaceae bacterium]
MVSVTFQVNLVENNDLVEITEEEISADREGHRPRLNAPDVLNGALWIRAAGQPPIEVVDELWQLTQVLCFACVCTLTADPPAAFLYRYMSAGAELTLTPDGPRLHIAGSDIPSATVEAAELLPALHQCGQRFLDLLLDLGPPAAEVHAYLAPFGERSAAGLKARALDPG